MDSILLSSTTGMVHESSTRTTACSILDETTSSNVYLSILLYGGQLGVAYYETESSVIHMLLETREEPPFNLISQLVEELQPAAIVTSAKQDLHFLEVLQNSSEIDNNDSSQASSNASPGNKTTKGYNFALDMLSSVEFGYQVSKFRLLSVDLPGIPDHYSDTEQAMHMSSIIPFESVASVRAAGGLIRYLEKKRVGVWLENPQTPVPISGFQTFTFKNMLHVDKSSHSALQIFQSVRHPSAYKASSREGLSLFGVLNRTTTRHGHKLLKSWFYRPTSDKNILKGRLDTIAFFVDPRNEEILHSIKNHLRNVKNVTRIVTKMKVTKLSVADWDGIYRTCQSALGIADICNSSFALPHLTATSLSLFTKIVKDFTSDLAGIMSVIENCMDIKSSKQENHFVVVPGVSTVVDEMKNTYAKLPTILGEIAQQELENYREYLSACQIVYLRRIGYLLYIRKSEILGDRESADSLGMKFVASANETLFYKTAATEKLDLEFGDILENIAYHELEVMSQLQNQVNQHATVFTSVMQHTAELDCLISLAIVAKEYKYIRPQLTCDHKLHVINSRHPLQEHAVALFVPNHIQFSSEDGLMKILTGPNASGKSIYLKQVGLIVFMAHIGSFIPAESASVCLLSSIYTVIRNPESLSMRLSTFASDLNQMSTVSKKADQGSLILIDEFGKGTATLDGVSLLASCLTHLIEKDNLPMVLCATHFHCLARQSLLPLSSHVRYQVMDTITSSAADTIYLYQLVDGVSERSFASCVARAAGIPSEIVSRGLEVCEIIRCNAPVRKFTRSSAVSYQKRCNSLADHMQKFTFMENFSVEQLLTDIKVIMGES